MERGQCFKTPLCKYVAPWWCAWIQHLPRQSKLLWMLALYFERGQHVITFNQSGPTMVKYTCILTIFMHARIFFNVYMHCLLYYICVMYFLYSISLYVYSLNRSTSENYVQAGGGIYLFFERQNGKKHSNQFFWCFAYTWKPPRLSTGVFSCIPSFALQHGGIDLEHNPFWKDKSTKAKSPKSLDPT